MSPTFFQSSVYRFSKHICSSQTKTSTLSNEIAIVPDKLVCWLIVTWIKKEFLFDSFCTLYSRLHVTYSCHAMQSLKKYRKWTRHVVIIQDLVGKCRKWWGNWLWLDIISLSSLFRPKYDTFYFGSYHLSLTHHYLSTADELQMMTIAYYIL